MGSREEKIKALCQSLEFKEGYLSDEFLFTIVGMDYFYYQGNIGQNDILDGYVDGKGDGGIDYVYSDDNTMYLAQGKTSSSISKEDLHNIFTKMERTIKLFQKGDYDKFNNHLKRLFINTIDKLPENPDIELVLFTNCKIGSEMEKQFRKEIRETSLQDYEIVIYDGETINFKSIEW
mgnify:CR=1 FL=1